MRQAEGLIHDQIVKRITDLAKDGHPIYVERRGAKGAAYKKGIPDIFIVFNGIHIEVEEKQPGGVRSVMQEKWEEKCRRLGIPYILVESADEVLTKIREELRKRKG